MTGKRFNAPNDAVVHPDGHIWFTDPGYGILSNYEGHKAEFELPTSVYRLNPNAGEAVVVTDEIERPNGICFSPDYNKLYIADTGPPKNIVTYDVVNGEWLANKQVFADMAPGAADGLRFQDDPTNTSGSFSFKKLSDFTPFLDDPVRLGMQIAFGRVRRKTAPTGPLPSNGRGPRGKTRPKNRKLNSPRVI